MNKRLLLVSALILWAWAGGSCPVSAAIPDSQAAAAVWHVYVSALKEGDREKAGACWSDRARRDVVLDWQIPAFDDAVSAAREDSLVLRGVEEHDGYVRLLVTSYGEDHDYYVVGTQGRAVLVNPVEVLTRDWSERETPFLTCHYAEGHGPTNEELRALDDFCGRVSADLGIPPGKGRTLDYYRCDSARQVGQLFGLGPAVGRALYPNGTVAAVSWTSFHEIVHAMLGPTCREQPVSLLLEGSACYFGGTTVLTRDAQLSWAKTLIENHEGLPLTRLVREEDFWSVTDVNDTYAEAAAFTGYLVATHGIDTFKKLYAYRDSTADLTGVLENLCGGSLGQIENDWHGWLLRQEVPTIGLEDERDARPVFRMKDPSHDDAGDGGYSYPPARGYKPGMFDLTGFGVRAGRGRVYFELKFRHLVDWESTPDWGFSGTFTRIAIDAGEHGDSDFGRDARAVPAGHCDYRIDVSDCGVMVMQRNRIVAVLKRVPPRARLGDTRRNVIRFSIPCGESEEAVRRWRYAVVVGGSTKGGPRLRDGVGLLMTVARETSKEGGGGGDDHGNTPNFYDVLLPAGQDQRMILKPHDREATVVLPMVH